MTRQVPVSSSNSQLAVNKVLAVLFSVVIAAILSAHGEPLGARQDASPTGNIADSLASWPTIQLPDAVVADTLDVKRRRLTLREIIARCIEGERSRLSGHRNMTCTASIRTAAFWENKKEIYDSVYRLYSDDENFSRSIQLAERKTQYIRDGDEWAVKTDENEDKDGTVQVETDGYSDFTELPIFLEELSEFDFDLLERFVEVDHVVFKIAFEPKSEFKPLPRGIVYVDTNNYRIIYEEYDFEQNPFPLILKDLKRMTRHWSELPGGQWVFTRLMAEIELRSDPFGFIPQRVAVAVVRDHFEFDTDYDERVFGERQ